MAFVPKERAAKGTPGAMAAEREHRHGRVRLFVETALTGEAVVVLSPEQSHYVVNVMRRQAGDDVFLFNGRDGEWCASVARASKNACELTLVERTRTQTGEADIQLLFAPLKRQRLEWLIEKATELGATRLRPVITRHTLTSRLNRERLTAHAVEAAEQSQRLSVPGIDEAARLADVLRDWSGNRKLLFCDFEDAPPLAGVLTPGDGEWAILTGPEGGFSADEREMVRGHDFVVPVSLGPRVLRAETAAIAALSVWQSLMGDQNVMPISDL
jgi:16S rRNA (uracil1498-N3)-methyltransferase